MVKTWWKIEFRREINWKKPKKFVWFLLFFCFLELEEIVNLLENNETSLDDSVELFQEGVQLSQYCSKKLGNVENKVSKILIDGQLEDFDVEVENNE